MDRVRSEVFFRRQLRSRDELEAFCTAQGPTPKQVVARHRSGDNLQWHVPPPSSEALALWASNSRKLLEEWGRQ